MNGKEVLKLAAESAERSYRYEEGGPDDRTASHFALACNGFLLGRDGKWNFNSHIPKQLSEQFRGEKVAFNGPGAEVIDHPMFSDSYYNPYLYSSVFEQKPVVDAIRRFIEMDEGVAARSAFILGGVGREIMFPLMNEGQWGDETRNAVRFVAELTRLGEVKSADAIACAMAMFVRSSHDLGEDREFVGNAYHMAETVRSDPVDVLYTEDLGLSQVARLKSFLARKNIINEQEFIDVYPLLEVFDDFPTVGAEWHFSPQFLKSNPDLWKRLAILNMSQYQKGSYIQLSRDERGVVEVRMNPSYYPITIANWNHIRKWIPEIDDAFFTITLNRQKWDFNWDSEDEIRLLKKMRTVALFTYATLFKNEPIAKRDQINFGDMYLGQTVRLDDENGFALTGYWGGRNNGYGEHGQVGLYTGFGENLPHLAYYLSMILADAEIVEDIPESMSSKGKEVATALSIGSEIRRATFKRLDSQIASRAMLKEAHNDGLTILECLNPQEVY